MKKLITGILALLLCLLMLPAALADGDVPPAEWIASGKSSFVEKYVGQRTADFCLTYVSAGITPGTGRVTISSTTEGNQVADTLGAKLTIQQWANNQWNYYFSCSVAADERLTYTYTRVVNVTPGYYYRLRVYHYGVCGGAFDDTTLYTKSAYVN